MKKLLLLLLIIPFTVFSQGPPNCVNSSVHIYLDQYMSETSWDIKDTAGNILASDGPYYNAVNYQSIIVPVCLPPGDLTFTIYDSYGDGLNGALWGGLDGSYFLKQCNDTLVIGSEPNFGSDTTHAFVSAVCPPIYGCTDPAYVEFDHHADTDDGSCQTLKIFGCTDSTMYNYDANANTMALIPNCDYVLTLYDLLGDGWVGSYLEVKQDTNEWVYSIDTALFQQDFIINLKSPMPVEFKFFVTQQASLTAAHCGFKLTGPTGQVMIEVLPPFIQPLFKYISPTYCGNLCIEKTFGCMDSLAVNYMDTVNTDDGSCYYLPGCINSSYLEYYTQGYVADYDDGTCSTLAVWGCIDPAAFNYDPLANISNGGCVPIVYGCMIDGSFNYNPNANTPTTCIPVVYGCTSDIAINYNPNANTDDGSCIGAILGCTDTAAFNFAPLANTDDGSCIPIIYGCINPIMFNYCDTCNTNDGSCIEILYGCTDSTMFNYNSLANVDNNSCLPFIYGCTDPSMLNYNPQANTEDFSCIPFIYGCMDSTALNYDSLANTDNGSCIEAIAGCRDPNAYNYNPLANVIAHDSLGCLYAADWCINGSGNPFFLNDECYAWVIQVDEYCCTNEWDNICELTYNHCVDGWSGNLPPARILENKIIIYPNPTKDIVNIVGKEFSIQVYNMTGKLITKKDNPTTIDLSNQASGIYTIQILKNNNIIIKKIIKN
tara:strand:- start:2359 stop:4500 length:2142 start_codon:yes stop_codon:yes gene_type:complete